MINNIVNYAPDCDMVKIESDNNESITIERDSSGVVYIVTVFDDGTENRIVLGQK